MGRCVLYLCHKHGQFIQVLVVLVWLQPENLHGGLVVPPLLVKLKQVRQNELTNVLNGNKYNMFAL